MAWATKRSTTTGPQEPRSASCSSTQIAAALGNRWVWRATLRACQAGTSKRRTRFQSRGRRWRRSRASAISCAPADGDMPNANANGSGVNAATNGVPSPPSDSSARRAGPPNVSTPVSVVAGCRSAQWAASWSLRNAACRSALFCGGGGFEHTGRVEVADLKRLPDRGAHGTKPSIDHRHSRPRIPCIHRGFSHRDLLVTWARPRGGLACSPGARDWRLRPSSTSEARRDCRGYLDASPRPQERGARREAGGAEPGGLPGRHEQRAGDRHDQRRAHVRRRGEVRRAARLLRPGRRDDGRARGGDERRAGGDADRRAGGRLRGEGQHRGGLQLAHRRTTSAATGSTCSASPAAPTRRAR